MILVEFVDFPIDFPISSTIGSQTKNDLQYKSFSISPLSFILNVACNGEPTIQVKKNQNKTKRTKEKIKDKKWNKKNGESVKRTSPILWCGSQGPTSPKKCLNHLGTILGNDAIFYRSNFRCLLDQNKIYNLIHYSIAICTRSKSGFSTNYCSIVVFRYRPHGWIILGNQGLNERRRNDWDQVKMIWQFMITIQNDNDSKLRGKWNVKYKKINRKWNSRSKDFLESNFYGE